MNPTANANILVLETRLESLEERQERHEEESLHRHEARAESEKAMAEALQAIRFDVHEIREGKKSILRMVKVGLAVFTFGMAGVVAVTNWAVTHWIRDLQVQNDPSLHRGIP